MRAFTGFLLFLFIGRESWAQSSAPAGAPMAISIRALFLGYDLPDGAFIPQPADVFVHPDLTTTLAVHAGDVITIDFFADGKKICSGKAVWHDAVTPKAQPGQAHPTYMMPAQFMVPNCIWTNLSLGAHAVNMRAYGFHGLSAVSGTMHFTVLPALPTDPVIGFHVLIGIQHPELKPAQVRADHAPPRTKYDVIGTVTARGPGMQMQDTSVAMTELKRQAGLMGANYIILGPITHSRGTPFSGPNKTFVRPEVHVSGTAVYVRPTE